MKIPNVGRFLCLVTGVLFINSCNKKADVVKPVYPISTFINGSPWNLNSVTGTLSLDTTHGERIVDITASDGTKTITMEFFDYANGNSIATGTHTFPSDAYFLFSRSAGTSDSTASGSVTVTANNPSSHTLSATFDFVAREYNGGAWTHIADGSLNNIVYSITYR